MIELGPNRYGKSAIRLVKVIREPDRHVVRDLTVAVSLEGDFGAAHTAGDNANVVATDTMKNTVYALRAGAPDRGHRGVRAGPRRALRRDPPGRAGHDRDPGAPLGPDPDRPGPGARCVHAGRRLRRTATVSATRDGQLAIEAGIDDLTVMKTAKSAFRGFPRDRYTTLPETDDRIMATRVSATWRYASTDLDWDAVFDGVRGTLLDVMAEHLSPSVQASIWIVGRAILERHAAVEEIRMVLPNLHHWTVDLTPFGLDNRNEIFTPTTEPHGLIEATVRRSADR